MSDACETRVPCSKETRRRLWNAKRGGESFNSLFRKMLAQYDPEEALEATEDDDTLKPTA